MTYLELCNKLKDLAGVAGSSISDVTATTPKINYLLCQWIKDAWIEIQSDPLLRPSFTYVRGHTLTLPPQTENKLYNAHDDFALEETVEFDYDTFAIKAELEDDIPLKMHRVEPNVYVYNDDLTGLPQSFVPVAKDSFYLFPTNSERCYIVCNCWDAPQEFSSNTDEPNNINAADQMAIVYRALVSYAIYDDAAEVLQYAIQKDREYTSRLWQRYNVNTRPKRLQFNFW